MKSIFSFGQPSANLRPTFGQPSANLRPTFQVLLFFFSFLMAKPLIQAQTPCEDTGVLIGQPGVVTTLAAPPANNLIRLQGTIRLINDQTWVDKEVKMGPNSEIILEIGSFTFQNSTFRGCQFMWKGIRSENASSINFHGNTRIEDAAIGLQASNNCDIAIFPNTYFYRNNIGLRLEGLVNAAGYPILYLQGAYFDNTVPLKPLSVGSDIVLEPQTTGVWLENMPNCKVGEQADEFTRFINNDIGVYIKNGVNINVEKCYISSTELINDNTGIFSNGADNLHIRKNELYDLLTGIQMVRSGYYVENNQIFGCSVGISATKTIPASVFGSLFVDIPTIERCTIKNSLSTAIGMNINWPGDYVVKNNLIENPKGRGISASEINGQGVNGQILSNQIFINSATTANYGIRLTEALIVTICDNDIQFTGPGRGVGIDLRNTGFNKISNNTINGFNQKTIGISARLSNDQLIECNHLFNSPTGIQINGSCLGADIRTNDFHEHKDIGLYYVNALTGIQPHKGNRWPYPTTSTKIGGRFFGTAFLPIYSRYKVDIAAAANPSEIHPFVNPEDWFFNENTPVPGTTPFCTVYPADICAQINGIQGDDNPKDFDHDIASGNLQPGSFVSGQNWTLKSQLLSRIQQKGWQSNSNLSTFWSQNQASTTGLGARLDVISDYWMSQNAALFSNIQAKIAQVQNLLAQNASPATVTVAANELMSLKNQLEANYQSLITSLMAANANPGASNLPIEQNQFEVARIKLLIAANSFTSISNTDKTILAGIAIQCPLDGGGAVFSARDLLDDLNRTATDYGDDCGIEPRENGQKIVENLSFSVVPNPSAGQFEVRILSLTGQDRVTVRIFDLVGRTFKEATISTDSFVSEIEKSGFYFIQLFSEKGQQLSAPLKLIVQH